jgi:DNA repair exonuclease SbcCD ATPase subunit
MKIIKLTSENVKRLTAVEITPTGNVIVIGGRNEQGKSSVLDSIEYTLGGEPDATMPVRKGEKSGKVVVNLGDIIVKRVFTESGGSQLVVTNADGIKQGTPQAILDKLTGKLTFDPLAFSRMKADKQGEVIRALVGLDFVEHDAARKIIFDERTAINREAKALEARLAAMPPTPENIPDREESTASLLESQKEHSEHNARNNAQRVSLQNAIETRSFYKRSAMDLESEIAALKVKLAELEGKLAEGNRLLSEAQLKVDALDCSKLQDRDLTVYKAKLESVEKINAAVRAKIARADVVAAYKAKTADAETLTNSLASVDEKKEKAISEAKYPIEGLKYDAVSGVSFEGIPFSQCSSAVQLKISVAIGFALNPKLKILLIRDGSLLDDDNMKVVADMAQAADAQIWMERVGTDEHTSVVIEDGHVKGL